MKTVIIVDHPHFDTSTINRRWLDEVRKYPDDFIVHNLQSAFPRGIIDAVGEHSLIDNNGSLVLQFPLYWFTCPPMLKNWCDTVLSPGWAYGGAHHLEGKKIALAVTTGAEAEKYQADGEYGHTLEECLLSLRMTIKYCRAEFAGIFSFCGAAAGKVDANAVADSARNYVDFLHNLAVSGEQAV